ncbi:MAG: ribosomal protein S18-alanine N-acetyltransferase [Alphaproteobacteria bacterium]|nr:ribosomal protein S18-alanine N-acetyltransferase [Alphaproteobacteria bacterium]
MIRSAHPDDAAVIARLEARAAFHPWSEASVRTTLEAPTTRALLAIDAEPVGYVLASAVAGEGEILTIGVDPDHRRRGVASELLRAVHALWREEHVQDGFLEVRATNDAARALYRAHGWEESGVRAGYYADGVDAVLMRWSP